MKNFKATFTYTDGADFPATKSKNSSGGTSLDGTSVNKTLIDDPWGFFQAALHRIGFTPNNLSEQFDNSQVLDAIYQEWSGDILLNGTTVINGTWVAQRFGKMITIRGTVLDQYTLTGVGDVLELMNFPTELKGQNGINAEEFSYIRHDQSTTGLPDFLPYMVRQSILVPQSTSSSNPEIIQGTAGYLFESLYDKGVRDVYNLSDFVFTVPYVIPTP